MSCSGGKVSSQSNSLLNGSSATAKQSQQLFVELSLNHELRNRQFQSEIAALINPLAIRLPISSSRQLTSNYNSFGLMRVLVAVIRIKILVEIASRRTFPFELKATSTWDAADSNRRVLTSSSRKLRQRFPGAVNHVLATMLYATGAGISRVRSLRLDFIEPGTLVNIRLEASVSHRLLAEATHRSTTIP